MHHQTYKRRTKDTLQSQILLEMSSTHQDAFTLKGKNFTFRRQINDIPPPFYFIMSSPMEVYNSSHCNDSDDIYAEPSMCCDHQNQLAQYFTLPHIFRADPGGVEGIQVDPSRFRVESDWNGRNPGRMVGMVGIGRNEMSVRTHPNFTWTQNHSYQILSGFHVDSHQIPSGTILLQIK